ncbi:hypothetical protein VQL36_11305 [Chengkuizengella sp. SCS-71B]
MIEIRDFVRNYIDNIYKNAGEIRTAMWRGLAEVMEMEIEQMA